MSDGRERDAGALEDILGYHFADSDLLRLALTHPSAVEGDQHPTNQRLEFLGDAVLDLACSEVLFRRHPDLEEGGLTRLRAALVRKETLATVARRIGLGDFLLMGRHEADNGGRQRDRALADALEACFGAMFLDAGLAPARLAFRRLFDDELRETAGEDPSVGINSKGRFQEWVHHHRPESRIVYEEIAREGPDHDLTFTVALLLDGEELATGRGASKRTAEAEAAQKALDRLDAAGHGPTAVPAS